MVTNNFKKSKNSMGLFENFIKEHSGDFKEIGLFNKLPKKINRGIFNDLLQQLIDSNKIGMDRKGYIVYIYNPELPNKLKDRPAIRL